MSVAIRGVRSICWIHRSDRLTDQDESNARQIATCLGITSHQHLCVETKHTYTAQHQTITLPNNSWISRITKLGNISFYTHVMAFSARRQWSVDGGKRTQLNTPRLVDDGDHQVFLRCYYAIAILRLKPARPKHQNNIPGQEMCNSIRWVESPRRFW